jgi:hypothetical protein
VSILWQGVHLHVSSEINFTFIYKISFRNICLKKLLKTVSKDVPVTDMFLRFIKIIKITKILGKFIMMKL